MLGETVKQFEKIMLIDDNILDLYITTRMIKKNNFSKEVIEYSNAAEAIMFLQENQDNLLKLPQLIFVDIYMPMMSGFEFMAAYDKLPLAIKNYCKAFIVSSSIDCSDIERVNQDKNVVAFQVKPITKEFLEHISTY